VREIGGLLPILVRQTAPAEPDLAAEERERLAVEICVATDGQPSRESIIGLGELVPFTCPECNGTLVRLKEGERVRYRCHVGHGFSASALLAAVQQSNEQKTQELIGSFDDAATLLGDLARDCQHAGQLETAQRLAAEAKETRRRAQAIHMVVFDNSVQADPSSTAR
jgi:two-component system chemotaxis response regulator CheB